MTNEERYQRRFNVAKSVIDRVSDFDQSIASILYQRLEALSDISDMTFKSQELTEIISDAQSQINSHF